MRISIFHIILSLCLLIISGKIYGQDNQSYQVISLNDQLSRLSNVGMVINGEYSLKTNDRGVAFITLTAKDLPLQSIEIKDSKLEAASWNVSKGIIEVVVRKKNYKLLNLKVINSDGSPVTNEKVVFQGSKIVSGYTNNDGDVELPIALKDEITSSKQFLMEDYVILSLNEENNIYTLSIRLSNKNRDNTPLAQSRRSLESTGNQLIDTIKNLESFYRIIKEYDLKQLGIDEAYIDARFVQLVKQLKDSTQVAQTNYYDFITDTTLLTEDVEILISQARQENQKILAEDKIFQEKIQLINSKLDGKFESLSLAEKNKLLENLNLLEGIVARNEKLLQKNQNIYLNIISELKERFFDLEEMEEKLEESENLRLLDREIFEQKLSTVLAVAVIIALLCILLIYLSLKLSSRKKKLEEANSRIKSINDNLEKTVLERTAQLRKTNKELDMVLYKASHDLRAPVCSLRGLANIAMTLSPGSNLELYQRMHLTADGMDKLLKKLAVVSEINRPVELAPFNVKNLFYELKMNFDDKLNEKNIKLKIRNDIKNKIISDKKILSEALSNIIENAISYSCREKTEKEIIITSKVEDSTLVVNIYDNGIGIENNIIDDIYNIFFRGTELSTGNGLGLFIVNKAIQRLNGKIEVHSTPTKFTEFTLIVPVEMEKATILNSRTDEQVAVSK